MLDFKTICGSKIVDASWDTFWSQLPGNLSNVKCKTVVISLPFEKNSADETQLVKMMEACKCNPEDYCVIQLAEGETIAWHQIRDAIQPVNILLLGIQPAALGLTIQFMPFQVNRFDGCSWIPTLSLTEIPLNQDIKKHTWNYGLKPVFIDSVYN